MNQTHPCLDCGKEIEAGDRRPECLPAYMAAMMDDDDHDFDDEELDDFDCGLIRNGQCTKAGSEECDFECPNRNSELFAGSAAWIAKHQRKKTK